MSGGVIEDWQKKVRAWEPINSYKIAWATIKYTKNSYSNKRSTMFLPNIS